MTARRLLLGVALVTALFAPQAAAAATFIVNTNDDGDTTCTPVHCSLREAIKAANAAAGHDQVVFAIPPGGPQSIKPIGRSLPQITDPVTIDATTQPGYAGKPIVELDGTLAGPGGVGFDVPAGQSVLTGFVINGFGQGLGGPGTGYAIRLLGAGGTTVEGNYIGTDLSGTAAPRPNDVGIDVDSADNTIGGTTPLKRNVMSGNGDAVLLRGTATRNIILGNLMGTDAAGLQIVGLNSRGVEIAGDASDNVVGGNLAGEGNVISGNHAGLLITSTGAGNRVQGNLIGTDVTGLAPLSTVGQTGILVTGPGSGGVVIGGPASADRNVISGNDGGGVYVQGAGNVVANNYVGIGVDGQTAVPNNAGGVFVDASDNVVGAPPPGSSVQGGPNVIAYNGGQGGVVVRLGVRSSILGNDIYLNSPTLGIDLFPLGPTLNDPGDADTGPNDLQNSPQLTAGSTTNGTVKIDGTLSSHPNTTYLLEFFANAACDETGFGEGQEFLADRFVTTDAAGVATFSFNFGAGQVGDVITATATDPVNNTSEFSNCTEAAELGGSVTTLTPPNAVNPVGTTHTVTANVVGASPGELLAGIPVYFTVTGSTNTGGQCTTDATGQCSFTYQGPDEPGSDLIEAYADTNGNGVQDPSEIGGSATKEWVAGSATAGQATGGGQIVSLTGKVVFGFSAKPNGSGLKGSCHVIDVSSKLHIKCTSIDSLVIGATHAAFSGQATVDGVATSFQIDVDDLAEPGAGRDTFKIQTGTGYTAEGVLTAGNIQIRQ